MAHQGLVSIEDGETIRLDSIGKGVDSFPFDRFRYRYVKRAFDISVILLFAPILPLVFAIICLVVRLSSPGPIFFGHRRIREHGNSFTMWKFRTMCVNSSNVLELYLESNPESRIEWQETHKLKNDPRVSPVGNFLRRTSLDELPQLWNVLCGSMSLVGPRPITPAEISKYGSLITYYTRVRPGITGLWQVSGRNEISYSQRVQLDATYALEWSLGRDILILCRTVVSIVRRHGAY